MSSPSFGSGAAMITPIFDFVGHPMAVHPDFILTHHQRLQRAHKNAPPRPHLRRPSHPRPPARHKEPSRAGPLLRQKSAPARDRGAGHRRDGGGSRPRRKATFAAAPSGTQRRRTPAHRQRCPRRQCFKGRRRPSGDGGTNRRGPRWPIKGRWPFKRRRAQQALAEAEGAQRAAAAGPKGAGRGAADRERRWARRTAALGRGAAVGASQGARRGLGRTGGGGSGVPFLLGPNQAGLGRQRAKPCRRAGKPNQSRAPSFSTKLQ